MTKQSETSLSGQLLVAMPGMPDPRFSKTVIYMCAHNSEGAMGLVVNRPIESLSFPDLLEQLGIGTDQMNQQIRVLFGGPVESGRGFVLHSSDYRQEATMPVDEKVALTATVDILKAIAGGVGPNQSLLALGYAGWGPGQLDGEIKANGWLNVDADDSLVFDDGLDTKWERALKKIGIDPLLLSNEAGNA
ncbi:MAG: YqgE/AlgH family protein [Rhodospirillales bacterium]